MLNSLLKYLVLLSPLVSTPIQGFWWRSTTTEAPSEPAMKQIPLTYFRTYTYQPMAGNPLPFPLMSSTDYISNYAAIANNPYFNPMMSMLPQGITAGGVRGNEISTSKFGTNVYRPAKSYAGANGVRSLNNGYLMPPTTSTSTTTSTTPKPTTTTRTTTTSTSTTTTTPAPTTTTPPTTTTTTTASTEISSGSHESGSSSGPTTGPLIKADALVNIDTAYPAFNRKVYTNHFNINYNRPVYPFPEYSIYKPVGPSGSGNTNEEPATSQFASPTISTPPNVEFVPCMCPVNIQGGGYPSGMPIAGNPSNSIFLAQGRTSSDMVEADTEMPAGGDAETATSNVTQSEVPLPKHVDDLQVVGMDDDEDVVTPSNGLVS